VLEIGREHYEPLLLAYLGHQVLEGADRIGA
jgi:hypothetical protein